VNAISTDYKRSGRKDEFGNEYRFKGHFMHETTWRPCYDVYLIVSD
jgi:hypothetical protein